MRGYFRFTWLLLMLLVPIGCGKDYKLAPVSGRVMMDSRPLANAEVRFVPTSGQDIPDSVATTDDEGHYELHAGESLGAVVGEHHVMISLDPRKNKRVFMAEGKMRAGAPGELLPSQYNRDSKLTCTVPPEGKKDADFDLKSK
ncbi:MAG TPA: hypothetical protein VGZ25_08305 [Gemmataceae bacterium]|jgi:hypothetical protein|nr:hypothetical protein [Gemmataceae bacterium]